MSVHDWVQNWSVGEIKSIPKNDTADEIIYYASSRFEYKIILVDGKLKRVCPMCHR
jgi:hypothetical protein